MADDRIGLRTIIALVSLTLAAAANVARQLL